MSTTGSFEHEYRTASEAVGLLDRSQRGKLALTGEGAKEFLQGQLTQDILALEPGHGAYAAFLTPKGKMLGDVRVLDAGAEILLDTERVALQALFNMIHRYRLGYAVELHKRTLESGLFSLVGPLADELIAAAGTTLGRVEHDHALVALGGIDARAIRTDLGVDLLFATDHAGAVRAALLEAGASGIGEQAAETLRIERGRPRYGIDLDESVIPQEAGLNERAVSFTKGCYVGQETVARLFYKGRPNRELRGLRAEAPLAPGTELSLDGRVVGTVTSAAVSPRLGPIGLALVRREAPPGSTVVAGPGLEALVSELPFL
jgi:folate-binding protein YgfZ